MAAYKKLSSQRHHGSNYSRLWLAEDHLLLVTTTGYTEEYRRFYFSDIQAITIQKTSGNAALNWALLAIALIFSAMGFFISEALIICLVFAGLSALGAGINAALGSSCFVQIQTAVATHPLQPLHRLPAAKEVIARLASLITAAQGELLPEQLAAFAAAPSSQPRVAVLS